MEYKERYAEPLRVQVIVYRFAPLSPPSALFAIVIQQLTGLPSGPPSLPSRPVRPKEALRAKVLPWRSGACYRASLAGAGAKLCFVPTLLSASGGRMGYPSLARPKQVDGASFVFV